jgi:hypothetical protein
MLLTHNGKFSGPFTDGVHVVPGPVPAALLENRRHAAMAYHLSKHKGYAAARDYYQQHTTDGFGGNNPKKMMLRWGLREDYRDNNAGRTGRPSQLDPQDVHKCIHEFLQGYEVQGPENITYKVYYTSIEDAVTSGQAPTINKIMGESPLVEIRTLWRNMKKLEPKLVKYKRPMDVKAVLTKEVKEARMKVATKLASMDVEKLDTVVWIDSKKIDIKPPGSKLKVYQPPGTTTVIEDERMARGKKTSGLSLNYYSGVTSLTGVLYFSYVTGTSDINKPPLRNRTIYKVKVRPYYTK